MTSSSTTNTWGISGPDFLLLYGALCLFAAAVAWLRWRAVLGPSGTRRDVPTQTDPYGLAMLTGGPALAVTAAVTKLYTDGLLASGKGRRALEVNGPPPARAAALERDIFEAVRRRPGITTDDLRRELEAGPAVQAMRSGLERTGLIAEPGKLSELNRDLLTIAGLLSVLAAARIAAGILAGKPISFLVLELILVLTASVVVGRIPRVTTTGRKLIRRLRRAQPRKPQARESVMAIALFGAGALWLADPSAAAALGVRRAIVGSGSDSTSGSGCGGGGGGCGGGGGGGGCGG